MDGSGRTDDASTPGASHDPDTGAGATDPGDEPAAGPADDRDRPARAATSRWVDAEPGLADWVAELDRTSGPSQRVLGDRAWSLARPGPIPPARTVRYLGAAWASRALRTATHLADLGALKPLRDPRRWMLETAVEGFVDQLALGGPASAEVARIIGRSGALFPTVLREELGRRGINPVEVTHGTASSIVTRAWPDLDTLDQPPIVNLPVSEVRVGRLGAAEDTPGGVSRTDEPTVTGESREVLVRFRRPGVTRELTDDVRLQASLAGLVQGLVPSVGGMHPLGFVELVARIALEEIDMRHEALNLVELALNLEALGADGVDVARPVAGRASERVVVLDRVEGVPFEQYTGELADPPATLAALMALTLESALLYGTFWADPAPEHLMVQPNGRVAIVGAGVVGHLPRDLKTSGIAFLKALFTGDAEGQVDAMSQAGAAPDDLDRDALVADLANADALAASAIMFGGEEALLEGLNEAVRLMLKHRLRPPVEVVLLLRTMFAMGRLADRVVPDSGGLMAGLLGLLPRLPELLAQAES